MYSLAPLYLSIAVGIPAVVAVVAVQTAAADVVGGVVVLAALAVATRAVLRLLAGDEQAAGATHS